MVEELRNSTAGSSTEVEILFTRLTDIFFMAFDRSEGPDVHINDSKYPTQTELGGLILTNGITNALLYFMIEIILVFQSSFSQR